MGQETGKLSGRSLAVLELIAAGYSYEQILATYPELTYPDIFGAAEESLELALGKRETPRQKQTLAEKRERYPRAYEKWSEAEDRQLRELVKSGATVAQIAGRLQRNRGAIRSRIIKENLMDQLAPTEQARLRRIADRIGIGRSG